MKIVKLIVTALFCVVMVSSAVSAATIQFTIGNLTLGEEIYLFKLKGNPFDSGDIKSEHHLGSWTYSKTSVYQVYDLMYLVTETKTPLAGTFLALEFNELTAVVSPFGSDNFEFGGYGDQHYNLQIDYIYDSSADTGEYIFSSVPLPAPIFLLIGGLAAIFGLKKRCLRA